MLWKIAEHTDEETQRYCWLRAMEWTQWPLFLAQPFIPPLLFFAAPKTILVSLVAVGWVWALIRYRVVNVDVAGVGCVLVIFLKWPSALICGAILFGQAKYNLAALSACWPLVTMGLQGLVPPGLTGIVEKKLIAQLLRSPELVLFGEPDRQPWTTSVACYLTPLFPLALVCGGWYLWTRLSSPQAPPATPVVSSVRT